MTPEHKEDMLKFRDEARADLYVAIKGLTSLPDETAQRFAHLLAVHMTTQTRIAIALEKLAEKQ